MQVRSLGYRTDLIFPAFDAEILDRGNYLVIRTPVNPSFYWGNFLLFDRAPREGDHIRWPKLFAAEIGTPPEVVHQTFGWDSATDQAGASQPFIEAGFRLNRSLVLTAQEVQAPPNTASDISVRPLLTDDEWRQATDNQIMCRDPEFEEAGYRVFRQGQMARYRAMVSAGLGAWFGAFHRGRLVADLGIFHDQALGRFQSVQTHPDYRRRGIGGTMVFEAARHALSHIGIDRLVIVADQDSAAARLYQALGFRPTEHQLGLESVFEKW